MLRAPSRMNLEAWQERGSDDAAKRANVVWKTLLAEYEQPVVEVGIAEALKDYVVRRKGKIAANLG